MTNCVFCRIQSREIPAEILFEDEHVLAILDINPIHFGHALIIPKRHCRDFIDLDQSSFPSILTAAQRIARALQVEFGLEGYNLFSNNGRTAGQSVFHFHLHIIPRYPDDNIHFVLNLKSYSGTEMADLGCRLRSHLSAEKSSSTII